MDKNPPANAGDTGSIPGSPGEGNGNPLQYSCLENPMDGGVWWATVYGVAKSWTHRVTNTFTFSKHSETSEQQICLGNFPGGPKDRTRCFHFHEPWFDP